MEDELKENEENIKENIKEIEVEGVAIKPIKRSIFDIVRDEYGLQLRKFSTEKAIKIVGVRSKSFNETTAKEMWECDVDKQKKVATVHVDGALLGSFCGPTNRFLERMCLNAVQYTLNERRRVRAVHKRQKAKNAANEVNTAKCDGAFFTPDGIECVFANPPFNYANGANGASGEAGGGK